MRGEGFGDCLKTPSVTLSEAKGLPKKILHYVQTDSNTGLRIVEKPCLETVSYLQAAVPAYCNSREDNGD